MVFLLSHQPRGGILTLTPAQMWYSYSYTIPEVVFLDHSLLGIYASRCHANVSSSHQDENSRQENVSTCHELSGTLSTTTTPASLLLTAVKIQPALASRLFTAARRQPASASRLSTAARTPHLCIHVLYSTIYKEVTVWNWFLSILKLKSSWRVN